MSRRFVSRNCLVEDPVSYEQERISVASFRILEAMLAMTMKRALFSYLCEDVRQNQVTILLASLGWIAFSTDGTPRTASKSYSSSECQSDRELEEKYVGEFEVNSSWMESLRAYKEKKSPAAHPPPWIEPYVPPEFPDETHPLLRKPSREIMGPTKVSFGRPALGSQLDVVLARPALNTSKPDGSVAHRTFDETFSISSSLPSWARGEQLTKPLRRSKQEEHQDIGASGQISNSALREPKIKPVKDSATEIQGRTVGSVVKPSSKGRIVSHTRDRSGDFDFGSSNFPNQQGLMGPLPIRFISLPEEAIEMSRCRPNFEVSSLPDCFAPTHSLYSQKKKLHPDSKDSNDHPKDAAQVELLLRVDQDQAGTIPVQEYQAACSSSQGLHGNRIGTRYRTSRNNGPAGGNYVEDNNTFEVDFSDEHLQCNGWQQDTGFDGLYGLCAATQEPSYRSRMKDSLGETLQERLERELNLQTNSLFEKMHTVHRCEEDERSNSQAQKLKERTFSDLRADDLGCGHDLNRWKKQEKEQKGILPEKDENVLEAEEVPCKETCKGAYHGNLSNDLRSRSCTRWTESFSGKEKQPLDALQVVQDKQFSQQESNRLVQPTKSQSSLQAPKYLGTGGQNEQGSPWHSSLDPACKTSLRSEPCSSLSSRVGLAPKKPVKHRSMVCQDGPDPEVLRTRILLESYNKIQSKLSGTSQRVTNYITYADVLTPLELESLASSKNSKRPVSEQLKHCHESELHQSLVHAIPQVAKEDAVIPEYQVSGVPFEFDPVSHRKLWPPWTLSPLRTSLSPSPSLSSSQTFLQNHFESNNRLSDIQASGLSNEEDFLSDPARRVPSPFSLELARKVVPTTVSCTEEKLIPHYASFKHVPSQLATNHAADIRSIDDWSVWSDKCGTESTNYMKSPECDQHSIHPELRIYLEKSVRTLDTPELTSNQRSDPTHPVSSQNVTMCSFLEPDCSTKRSTSMTHPNESIQAEYVSNHDVENKRLSTCFVKDFKFGEDPQHESSRLCGSQLPKKNQSTDCQGLTVKKTRFCGQPDIKGFEFDTVPREKMPGYMCSKRTCASQLPQGIPASRDVQKSHIGILFNKDPRHKTSVAIRKEIKDQPRSEHLQNVFLSRPTQKKVGGRRKDATTQADDHEKVNSQEPSRIEFYWRKREYRIKENEANVRSKDLKATDSGHSKDVKVLPKERVTDCRPAKWMSSVPAKSNTGSKEPEISKGISKFTCAGPCARQCDKRDSKLERVVMAIKEDLRAYKEQVLMIEHDIKTTNHQIDYSHFKRATRKAQINTKPRLHTPPRSYLRSFLLRSGAQHMVDQVGVDHYHQRVQSKLDEERCRPISVGSASSPRPLEYCCLSDAKTKSKSGSRPQFNLWDTIELKSLCSLPRTPCPEIFFRRPQVDLKPASQDQCCHIHDDWTRWNSRIETIPPNFLSASGKVSDGVLRRTAEFASSTSVMPVIHEREQENPLHETVPLEETAVLATESFLTALHKERLQRATAMSNCNSSDSIVELRRQYESLREFIDIVFRSVNSTPKIKSLFPALSSNSGLEVKHSTSIPGTEVKQISSGPGSQAQKISTESIPDAGENRAHLLEQIPEAATTTTDPKLTAESQPMAKRIRLGPEEEAEKMSACIERKESSQLQSPLIQEELNDKTHANFLPKSDFIPEAKKAISTSKQLQLAKRTKPGRKRRKFLFPQELELSKALSQGELRKKRKAPLDQSFPRGFFEITPLTSLASEVIQRRPPWCQFYNIRRRLKRGGKLRHSTSESNSRASCWKNWDLQELSSSFESDSPVPVQLQEPSLEISSLLDSSVEFSRMPMIGSIMKTDSPRRHHQKETSTSIPSLLRLRSRSSPCLLQQTPSRPSDQDTKEILSQKAYWKSFLLETELKSMGKSQDTARVYGHEDEIATPTFDPVCQTHSLYGKSRTCFVIEPESITLRRLKVHPQTRADEEAAGVHAVYRVQKLFSNLVPPNSLVQNSKQAALTSNFVEPKLNVGTNSKHDPISGLAATSLVTLFCDPTANAQELQHSDNVVSGGSSIKSSFCKPTSQNGANLENFHSIRMNSSPNSEMRVKGSDAHDLYQEPLEKLVSTEVADEIPISQVAKSCPRSFEEDYSRSSGQNPAIERGKFYSSSMGHHQTSAPKVRMAGGLGCNSRESSTNTVLQSADTFCMRGKSTSDVGAQTNPLDGQLNQDIYKNPSFVSDCSTVALSVAVLTDDDSYCYQKRNTLQNYNSNYGTETSKSASESLIKGMKLPETHLPSSCASPRSHEWKACAAMCRSQSSNSRPLSPRLQNSASDMLCSSEISHSNRYRTSQSGQPELRSGKNADMKKSRDHNNDCVGNSCQEGPQYVALGPCDSTLKIESCLTDHTSQPQLAPRQHLTSAAVRNRSRCESLCFCTESKYLNTVHELNLPLTTSCCKKTFAVGDLSRNPSHTASGVDSLVHSVPATSTSICNRWGSSVPGLESRSTCLGLDPLSTYRSESQRSDSDTESREAHTERSKVSYVPLRSPPWCQTPIFTSTQIDNGDSPYTVPASMVSRIRRDRKTRRGQGPGHVFQTATSTGEISSCVSEDFHRRLGKAVSFKPRPGDVIIVRRRRSHRLKDNGYVFFCTRDHEKYPWKTGDFVLRFGKFVREINWKMSSRMKLFQRTHNCLWMSVGLLEKPDIMFPWVKREMVVDRHCHFFVPRRGDLIVRPEALGPESPSQLERWTLKARVNAGDILARLLFGDLGFREPREEVEAHVEIYIYGGKGLSWIFMGRDDCWYNNGYDLLKRKPCGFGVDLKQIRCKMRPCVDDQPRLNRSSTCS